MEPTPAEPHDQARTRWTARAAKPVFLRDEPIPLALAFENDGQARDFPLEPNVLDVLGFELFDADGRLLRRANGYTWEERLGNEPLPRDAAELPRARVPPGGRVEWTEDLLSYVGVLEPGRYGVRVGLRYVPAGIDLWSERIELCVEAPRVRHVDLVADRAAVPVVHSVQLQGGSEGEVGGLVHFRLASALDVHWEGQVFPGDPRLDWIAATTDFTSSDRFDHDFSRWWAAIDGSELHLVEVLSKADPLRATVSTGLREPRLLARPIQHHDGGCSLVLWTASDGARCVVHRLRLGPDGAVVQGLGAVAQLELGIPTASGLARDGSIVVVTARDGLGAETLVRLSGSEQISRPLPHPPHETVAPCWVRLDLRRRRPEGDRLHLGGVVDTPRGPRLWAAWADIDAEPIHWSHGGVDRRELPLADDDDIVWADGLLDRDGNLHVLACARSGRSVLWSAGSEPRLVTDAVPHLAGMPRLIDCGGHLHVVDARPATGLLFHRLL